MLRLLKARTRLSEHHSAQMPNRGRGQNAGHNHVLAAIADAIHASNTWKGKGKGAKGDKGGVTSWQSGRNCAHCGDYNFEYRNVCRQCGASLPPPAWTKGGQQAGDGKATSKGWGKGGGSGQKAGGGEGGGGGNGKGANAEAKPAAQGPPAAAAAAPVGKEDSSDETKDPAERVKEIRAEEERLRRARGPFVDTNPRMVSVIDSELAKLASERECLQPLEINLQAAAGRTANARASLAKAREKKETAARELRNRLDAFREAEKEVKEAEDKLRATEAAATAKRGEVRIGGVQDAVEFLQQTAVAKVEDKAVAKEMADALQKIARMLSGLGTAQGSEGGGHGKDAEAKTGGGDQAAARDDRSHPVVAVCGATANKKLLLTVPQPQHPAALAGITTADDDRAVPTGKGSGDGGGDANASGQEVFAGGAVDGEIVMGQSGKHPRDDADYESLEASAAAALGDDNAEL